jgi:hypothetical protein
MTAVIPARFLFRWSWPVRRLDGIPARAGQLLNLSEQYRLTPLSDMDGGPSFADVRIAWNPGGLGVSVEVQGKTAPLECSTVNSAFPDGMTIWLDTRATQNVHRATRYCHQFRCLPAGSGTNKKAPSVTTVPMNRGDGDRTTTAVKERSAAQVWSEIRSDGYLLEVWLPAESIVGFDPENHRQLGFYYVVKDREHGEQLLTVNHDFPFEYDPSIWQMLELCDD